MKHINVDDALCQVRLARMNHAFSIGILSLAACCNLQAAADSEVHVLGQMRRMFTARDIKSNVDLAKVTQNPHVYALGPIGGLTGEITVLDGQVFVSKAKGEKSIVSTDPQIKAVFL